MKESDIDNDYTTIQYLWGRMRDAQEFDIEPEIRTKGVMKGQVSYGSMFKSKYWNYSNAYNWISMVFGGEIIPYLMAIEKEDDKEIPYVYFIYKGKIFKCTNNESVAIYQKKFGNNLLWNTARIPESVRDKDVEVQVKFEKELVDHIYIEGRKVKLLLWYLRTAIRLRMLFKRKKHR